MKRLTTIERCGLLFGIVLFVFGVISIAWPQSGLVPHFTNDWSGASPRYAMEPVSEIGARIYGILATLMGAVIVIGSVYREKK